MYRGCPSLPNCHAKTGGLICWEWKHWHFPRDSEKKPPTSTHIGLFSQTMHRALPGTLIQAWGDGGFLVQLQSSGRTRQVQPLASQDSCSRRRGSIPWLSAFHNQSPGLALPGWEAGGRELWVRAVRTRAICRWKLNHCHFCHSNHRCTICSTVEMAELLYVLYSNLKQFSLNPPYPTHI